MPRERFGHQRASDTTQHGEPDPCAKPFTNQTTMSMIAGTWKPTDIVASDETNRPNANIRRMFARSARNPHTNLPIA